jgi:hypothetical protein
MTLHAFKIIASKFAHNFFGVNFPLGNPTDIHRLFEIASPEDHSRSVSSA